MLCVFVVVVAALCVVVVVPVVVAGLAEAFVWDIGSNVMP